jgi:hypothetical protein
MPFREIKSLATEPSCEKKRDAIWALADMLQEIIDNIRRYEQ